ncbi:MAG: hypothetical protein GF350_12520 [Chitinivibrionales bacterium]|nr:hypothetical protein [Chitinivibrionales bacterium]
MSKCEECGINQANVHLSQIIDNKPVVMHLCEECARKKGISISVETGTISPGQGGAKDTESVQKEITCRKCHMTFARFKAGGKLGCSECYNSFKEEIDTMLKQVHGSCLHKGKQYPHGGKGISGSKTVEQLRKEMNQAVRNEEFELAAAIRDTLKNLESRQIETENTVEHK